jgi:hypothetical protein
MGLDIYKNKTANSSSKELDYFRFNWAGCEHFENWCSKKGLPNPFPNWNGSNDGDLLDCAKQKDRKFVTEWLDAYKNLFPRDYQLGVGNAMRDIMFHVNDIKNPEPFYKEEFRDWERWTALAWSWFLRDALEKKSSIRYC